MTLHVKHKHLLTFVSVMVAAWALGTFLFIYYRPHLAYNAFERAILEKGFGDGPIPINTLQTEPQALFADPLHPPPSATNLATTGVNRDTLLTVGWLDLSQGPQVLHVPDMQGRYYSVQFTDRSDGTNFAYVGTRATGTDAGAYLITGPGWTGAGPPGIAQISSPNNSVLVIGRVLVDGDADLPAVYALSTQIQLTPLSSNSIR
jgi:hypothetical protein